VNSRNWRFRTIRKWAKSAVLSRLQNVFKCFESNDVRYVVIGGIAAVLHGVPRATFDLDILIEATESNAERLLQSLRDAGFGTAFLTDAKAVLANEITVFHDRVRIDVQTKTPGLSFGDAWDRRTMMSFQGQQFPVASRQDLIASKLAAGRPKDLEDARALQPGPEPEDRPDAKR
jgi:hypothetical protein